MDTLAIIKRIELRLAELGMSKADFYSKSGISSASYSQWNTGKYKPSIAKLRKAAEVLEVSFDYLKGSEATSAHIPDHPQFLPIPKMKQWRVVGATACGEPTHYDLEEMIWAPDNINADLVFRCVGDSMIGAHIFDGDIAFVRSGDVEDGQIAVVRIEDEYSLKRIYHGVDYLELRSENPKYPPIIIRGEQINAEIVGRAVFVLTRVI